MEESPLYLSNGASAGRVHNFAALMVQGKTPTVRPDSTSFHAIYALVWPELEIAIPWLEGKTIKESIIEWALEEYEEADVTLLRHFNPGE